ncbi:MAG: hypothetical protein ABL884_10380 [Methyloglobulus sp.]
MKNIMLKNALAATLLMLAVGQSGVASAHEIFNGDLGANAGAFDKYTLTCFSDASGTDPDVQDTGPADRLVVTVRDQNAGPALPDENWGITNAAAQVRVIAFKVSGSAATNAATLVADSATETNDLFSAALNVNSVNEGGNGNYEIYVSKSASGTEDYDVTAHCQENTGVLHTGTTEPVLVVNQ